MNLRQESSAKQISLKVADYAPKVPKQAEA